MKSKDVILQEMKEKLSQAFKSTDEAALAQVFANFAEEIQQGVMDDFSMYQKTQDVSILAKRGIHQLTNEETEFYQSIIGAMKMPNPSQAVASLNIAFPETVIDNIIADIKTEHPLLDAVNFMNTTILTKLLVNKQGTQLATWGAIDSKIATELVGAIGKIDLMLCKLSAFMPISKDMLEVGPAWVDAYVRATLSEAIALALETAIVTGTGKSEPIGMDRNVSDGVTVTAGVYPRKDKVVVADLGVASFGAILGSLSEAPNGTTRAITEIIMVVNPKDYFTKVLPATTIRAMDGTYSKDVFPFPTKVMQSPAVPAGEAIFGIGKKYLMGIGSGSNGGKLEYSDEFRFLDDERVYLTKLHGNGRALDDKAFILADISGILPATLEVSVKNVVKTKEQTT